MSSQHVRESPFEIILELYILSYLVGHVKTLVTGSRTLFTTKIAHFSIPNIKIHFIINHEHHHQHQHHQPHLLFTGKMSFPPLAISCGCICFRSPQQTLYLISALSSFTNLRLLLCYSN